MNIAAYCLHGASRPSGNRRAVHAYDNETSMELLSTELTEGRLSRRLLTN